MNRFTACCAALPMVLAACASRQMPDSAPASEGPRLISCSDARLLTFPQKGQGVLLEYTVRADGRVDPLSIRERRNGIVNPSGNAVNAARQIAASCVYAPAIRNGEAIVTTVRQYMTLDVAAEQRVELRPERPAAAVALPGQRKP